MIYKKRKNNRILKNILNKQTAISFLGLFIIVLISVPLAKNISKQYEINNEIEQLQTEINQLEGKNENLKELISFLESDQFVDEEARKNLNFKKPGEEVVVIKDKLTESEPSSMELNSKYMVNQPTPYKKKDPANPEKWLEYFFANNNL